MEENSKDKLKAAGVAGYFFIFLIICLILYCASKVILVLNQDKPEAYHIYINDFILVVIVISISIALVKYFKNEKPGRCNEERCDLNSSLKEYKEQLRREVTDKENSINVQIDSLNKLIESTKKDIKDERTNIENAVKVKFYEEQSKNLFDLLNKNFTKSKKK